jgi:sterol desaturase/sphingolipid hydroxylase (fatty acid hydroxylase superfamily)
MIYERLHVTFVGVVATLVGSVVVAEFAGYWLHRLVHSNKFPALSRGHLVHRLLIYGSRQSMRARGHLDATDSRTSVGNVGVEWLAPSAIILLFCWGAKVLFGVPPVYQVLALCTAARLAHPDVQLPARRDAPRFWMTRVPFLRAWFLNARRRHDIYHRSVDSEGCMDTNYGIGFYFFDRFFRTIAKRHRPFNWEGYHAAIERSGLDDTDLLSLRGCSQALFHKEAGSKMAARKT